MVKLAEMAMHLVLEEQCAFTFPYSIEPADYLRVDRAIVVPRPKRSYLHRQTDDDSSCDNVIHNLLAGIQPKVALTWVDEDRLNKTPASGRIYNVSRSAMSFDISMNKVYR